jgi:hypothetical protein
MSRELCTEFVIMTEELGFVNEHRLGIDAGVLLFIICDEEVKPFLTVGDNHFVPTLWNKEVGMCPYINTHAISNCTLHCDIPIKVTLYWLVQNRIA